MLDVVKHLVKPTDVVYWLSVLEAVNCIFETSGGSNPPKVCWLKVSW